MGNSASSSSGRVHHEETVDFGYLAPHGIYTGPQDWNQEVVSQLISSRRLAPFYRPLEDYNDSWSDEQILASRKEPALSDPEATDTAPRTDGTFIPLTSVKSFHNKRSTCSRDSAKIEASIYRGAVECPICFLYYPPNINHSRCCDQAICTECFVQIKRIEPTTTHCVSEPAACPYCVQENFGVVYNPPLWRSGIGSETSSDAARNPQSMSLIPSHSTHKRRQKSYGPGSPEVALIDHIRPDWEAKLSAVRAAIARRANRRIVMRHVGERYIPVGIASGRVHPLNHEESQGEGVDNTLSRRSRRRNQENQNHNFEIMGMAGRDLEEFMLMEAMRLSLIDHEEHQRREAEEKNNETVSAASTLANASAAVGRSSTLLPSESASAILLSPSPKPQITSQHVTGDPGASSSYLSSQSRTRALSSCSSEDCPTSSSQSSLTSPPAQLGMFTASVSSSPSVIYANSSSHMSEVLAGDNLETGTIHFSSSSLLLGNHFKYSHMSDTALPRDHVPLDPPLHHGSS